LTVFTAAIPKDLQIQIQKVGKNVNTVKIKKRKNYK